MRGFRNSAGDADDQYDPDIIGDGPSAPFMRGNDGSATRYAAARYGQPGDPIGVRDQNGNDMGPQWARKGTAAYLVNPPDYNGRIVTVTRYGGTGSVKAWVTLLPDGSFQLSDGQTGRWYTRTAGMTPGNSYEVLASVDSGAGSISNEAAGWVSLSSNRTVTLTAASWANRVITLSIRPNGGAVASTGRVTLQIVIDG